MLTLEELEDIFSRTRIIKTPKEIFQIENAVIITPENAVAIAATRPFGDDRIILTALSDRSSPLHEGIHRRGVLSESLTARLTNWVLRFNKRAKRVRNVKFKQCKVGSAGCISEQHAFEAIGITEVQSTNGKPLEITHFVRLEQ